MTAAVESARARAIRWADKECKVAQRGSIYVTRQSVVSLLSRAYEAGLRAGAELPEDEKVTVLLEASLELLRLKGGVK